MEKVKVCGWCGQSFPSRDGCTVTYSLEDSGVPCIVVIEHDADGKDDVTGFCCREALYSWIHNMLGRAP